MADRKRTKLSLKRKTISNNLQSSLFNTIRSKQLRLRLEDDDRDADNVIIDLSSESDTEIDDDGTKRPSKRSKLLGAGGDVKIERAFGVTSTSFKSSTCIETSVLLPTATAKTERALYTMGDITKTSSFLDVDQDLRKLRLMFVKLQKPCVNIRSLSELPGFSQNVQVSISAELEEEKKINDLLELSPLPPVCSWCFRRKPVDYSNVYDAEIQENLQDNAYIPKTVAQPCTPRESHAVVKETIYSAKGNNSANDGEKNELSLSKNEMENTSAIPSVNMVMNKGSNSVDLASRLVLDSRDISKTPSKPSENLSCHLSDYRGVQSTQVQFICERSTGTNIPILSVTPCQSRSELQRTGTKENNSVPLSKPTGRTSEGPQPSGDGRHVPGPVITDTRSCTATVKDDPSKPAETGNQLVQSCPLCQVKFEKGDTQMDIDGHIALCFSTCGDDAIW